MKKTIKFLGLFVTVVLLTLVNTSMVNAETVERTYTYSDIPARTILYENEPFNTYLNVSINGTTYKITSYCEIQSAYCDKYGTIWADCFDTLDELYYLGFYNFELQGNEECTFHLATSGRVEAPIDNAYYVQYGCEDGLYYCLLPKKDALKHNLLTGETITIDYIGNPYLPTPSTEPEPSITPTIQPTHDVNSPQPSSNPVIQPSSSPTVKSSSSPVIQPSSNPIIPPTPVPANKSKKKAIVKKSKNNIQITYCGDTSKVITLKKSGTLKYKNKVIKNVKDVAFTKNGTIVYFKKNGDAYYMSSSKIKHLRYKVKSIKKKNNFAIGLKLKNGKTVKLRI